VVQKSSSPSADEHEFEDRLDRDTMVAHRYRILRFAGSRGFGQVYQAQDSATEGTVSLMRLDREFSRPGVRDRFFNTRGSAQIEHPAAVDLTDYGEDFDGRLFLVMAWIDQAEALDELLAREHTLGWSRARALVEKIAEGLSAAHARGILHGGLEPSRILIDREGNPHVLDFGLAPALESTTNANKPTPQITDTRVLAGKPAYMPPELVRGDRPTERSDIYALGLILWELIAGKPPFTGSPVDTLHSQLHDPLPELVRGDAPPEVEALLHLALAKDPDERFASADELIETLRALPGASATPKPLPRTPTVPLSATKPGRPSGPATKTPTAPQPAVAAPVLTASQPELIAAPTIHATPVEPSPQPPASKRRVAMLERAIIGFLLFDLALFGAWKLLGSNDGSSEVVEPVAAAEPIDDTLDEPVPAAQPTPEPEPEPEPEPAVAELAIDEPDEPTPTPALALDPLNAEALPKQLGDADFRKTMVDARATLVERCLDDQKMRRTFKVSIAVAPSGRVEWATVLEAPGKTALGKCISKQTRRIEFPPSQEGGSHVYSLRLR
jgi:serine/threonine protein kinase